MRHLSSITFFVFTCMASTAFAQRWEVGVAGGGSFYTGETVKNALGNADASLANGFALSGWLANNSNNTIGGELRYDYERSDLKLSSNGTNVSFGGQTNAIHYDFLLHFAPSESHVRPFIAGGAGVKVYSGIGKEQPFQPLSDVALLTKTSEVQPLVSVGAGLKFSLTRGSVLRLEAHDYLTPFPKSVIAPAEGSKVGGWLSDFIISAGLSFGL
jgi:Outer membrane protein beta-barrel domain